MSEIIYVIVSKETGLFAPVSGSRSIPAYTTEGRANYAMKTHRFSEDRYEVAEFIRKEDD